MLGFLRGRGSTKVLNDASEFWRHANATQYIRHTAEHLADQEERLDLRAGKAIKALLEREVGPEEGQSPVQMQNWDWNDDRTRAVYIVRDKFRADLIPKLQALLVDDFSDFRIIVLLMEELAGDVWGCLLVTASQLVIQRNVAQAYVVAV